MCGAWAMWMLWEVCVWSVACDVCMRCAELQCNHQPFWSCISCRIDGAWFGRFQNHQPCWSCISCRIDDAWFGKYQGTFDFVLLVVDMMCGAWAMWMLCEVRVCSVACDVCMWWAEIQPIQEPWWSCISCKIEDASFGGEFQSIFYFVLLGVDVMCGLDAVWSSFFGDCIWYFNYLSAAQACPFILFFRTRKSINISLRTFVCHGSSL